MRWLRLRPQTAAELDAVDWRGRWIGSEEEYDDNEEVAEDGPMEDFDPVRMMLTDLAWFSNICVIRIMG